MSHLSADSFLMVAVVHSGSFVSKSWPPPLQQQCSLPMDMIDHCLSQFLRFYESAVLANTPASKLTELNALNRAITYRLKHSFRWPTALPRRWSWHGAFLHSNTSFGQGHRQRYGERLQLHRAVPVDHTHIRYCHRTGTHQTGGPPSFPCEYQGL
jgi:hypothetical protein